jgi:hypothetical protein
MTGSQDTTPAPRFTDASKDTPPATGHPTGSLPDPTNAGEATPSGGRVDAGAAVTGDVAGSRGEAPPGGYPDDDSSLSGDRE